MWNLKLTSIFVNKFLMFILTFFNKSQILNIEKLSGNSSFDHFWTKITTKINSILSKIKTKNNLVVITRLHWASPAGWPPMLPAQWSCCFQNKFKFKNSDWMDWSYGIGCQNARSQKLGTLRHRQKTKQVLRIWKQNLFTKGLLVPCLVESVNN